MQELYQTIKLCVILPKHRANYKRNAQTLVIIGNVHRHVLPYTRSLLYTALYIA